MAYNGPINTREDFATAVLTDLGVPVSATNMSNILDWMAAENPVSNWAPRNNPLNNGFGSGGGSGLGSYPSLTVAAQDVAANLSAGNYGYGAITQALQSSAPQAQFTQAVVNSDWANSHYAGSAFANGQIANANAPGNTPSANVASSPTATSAVSNPSQSVVIGGQTYTTPAGDQNASTQISAIGQMAATMSTYGIQGADLQNVVNWAWTEMTSNVDPSQVAIDFQTPGTQGYQVFEKYFPGFTAANQQLTSQGLKPVNVGQYQDYQTMATQLAQAAGLPPGFINKENVGILIGNNVSQAELTARVNDATTLAYQSTPEQQAMFNQYFGLPYQQQMNANDPMAFGQSNQNTTSGGQVANGTDFQPTGHGPLTVGQIAAIALDPQARSP